MLNHLTGKRVGVKTLAPIPSTKIGGIPLQDNIVYLSRGISKELSYFLFLSRALVFLPHWNVIQRAMFQCFLAVLSITNAWVLLISEGEINTTLLDIVFILRHKMELSCLWLKKVTMGYSLGPMYPSIGPFKASTFANWFSTLPQTDLNRLTKVSNSLRGSTCSPSKALIANLGVFSKKQLDFLVWTSFTSHLCLALTPGFMW